MPRNDPSSPLAPARGSRLLRSVLAVAGTLVLGGLALAALAMAASTSLTVRSTHNASLAKTIVVDGKGQTLYALHPETAHHLLCTSASCLQFWPPLTVSSKAKLKAGPGVTGHLGVLRRRNGSLQVTLGGLPLYRFSLDHGVKGNANGQGIMSFGGTWHVITAKTSSTAAPTPAPTSTTPASTTPMYATPGY